MEPISTGHWVRPRPGLRLWQVVLALAFIYGATGALAFFVNGKLFTPVSLTAVILLIVFIRSRLARHLKRVAADIKARYDIEVPPDAMEGLLHGRESVFTYGGKRYRIERSHTPGPDNDWAQAKIVVVPMGADAATLFGY